MFRHGVRTPEQPWRGVVKAEETKNEGARLELTESNAPAAE